MKKILLLLPLLLVLLVSGCTQDPKEIVRGSIEKLEALDSYKASYGLSLSMYGLILEGDMDLYKKGDKTRVDTSMAMGGEGIVSSTYSLPSGVYSCTELAGNATCTKGEAQAMMSPEESLEMNMELIESGVINLKFNNIATITGRNCYNITSEFNVSKLGTLEPEALEGLGMEEEMLQSLDAFTQFDIISCYDFETGMPLEMSMFFEVDTSKLPQQAGLMMPDKMSMTLGMTATGFEPNMEIADSVFELPVEPLDLAEMQRVLEESESCTDNETGEGMTYGEAREIALSSGCAENATLGETHLCNDITGTWWIDLELEQTGCAPACVVSIPDRTAEINWRCTGLIPE